jgi:hypothetical protein
MLDPGCHPPLLVVTLSFQLSVDTTSSNREINGSSSSLLGHRSGAAPLYNPEIMVQLFIVVLNALRGPFRSRRDFDPRSERASRRAETPTTRPLLNPSDRLFWTTLRRSWSRWADVLRIVNQCQFHNYLVLPQLWCTA